MFIESCSSSHVQRVMFNESCSASHVQRVMFSESCSVSHVQRVMFNESCSVSHIPRVMFNKSCSASHVQRVVFRLRNNYETEKACFVELFRDVSSFNFFGRHNGSSVSISLCPLHPPLSLQPFLTTSSL
ncbi:hypothetical protein Pmani_018163 [Petrolisthes manimaculis]|uniref:Uncharacterized protein n=1 Tax=Petrolisthes manimaculis TaxID=1843537 RepID=A0AAE1PN99_9EUCA|nr:hypothetical protein Pmani_018163 [Petrolisthes manimaculis]